MRTSRRSVLVLLLGMLALAGCNARPSSLRQQSSDGHTSSRPNSGPRRDLSVDEEEGGHTLARHVSKTDSELAARLNAEPNIVAASTYTDRIAAESAVGTAIANDEERISRWLDRTGRHANLVLDYSAPQPIGRSLRRGEQSAQACSHALVVLKWLPPGRYFVLTSYPDCT